MRKKIYVVTYALALALVVSSLLSLLVDTDSRYLKALDFPRIQFFWATAVALVVFPLLAASARIHNTVVIVGLAVGLAVQASYLYAYSPLAARTVPDIPADAPEDVRFSLLMANVKMGNRQAARLLELVRARAPDIFLAMEIDAWWDEQLAEIERAYPHTHEVINDRSYGMVLYSHLPLRDVQTHYRQNESVPSFSAIATLPNGRDFRLHTVHPVPPTSFQSLPDNEGQSEVELLQVGEEVAASELPAVVLGDFNDVAWGATERLTGSRDLLFDVRTGRGVYTTYNAHNPLIRWPLDHVVVTEEWAVGGLERLGDIHSDHFPVYAELALVDD